MPDPIPHLGGPAGGARRSARAGRWRRIGAAVATATRATRGGLSLSSVMDNNAACISRRLSPPRIVMLDDEPAVLQCLTFVMRLWFKDAVLLTFDSADNATEELAREAPDLFTTDVNHLPPRGYEMLRTLAATGAKYPILVISAFATEEAVREWAGPELNAALLRKPFQMEDLRRELQQRLGPIDGETLAHEKTNRHPKEEFPGGGTPGNPASPKASAEPGRPDP